MKIFRRNKKSRWLLAYEEEQMSGVPIEQQMVTDEERIRGRTPEEVLKDSPSRIISAG